MLHFTIYQTNPDGTGCRTSAYHVTLAQAKARATRLFSQGCTEVHILEDDGTTWRRCRGDRTWTKSWRSTAISS